LVLLAGLLVRILSTLLAALTGLLLLLTGLLVRILSALLLAALVLLVLIGVVHQRTPWSSSRQKPTHELQRPFRSQQHYLPAASAGRRFMRQMIRP
jgi:hypothetical protein